MLVQDPNYHITWCHFLLVPFSPGWVQTCSLCSCVALLNGGWGWGVRGGQLKHQAGSIQAKVNLKVSGVDISTSSPSASFLLSSMF